MKLSSALVLSALGMASALSTADVTLLPNVATNATTPDEHFRGSFDASQATEGSSTYWDGIFHGLAISTDHRWHFSSASLPTAALARRMETSANCSIVSHPSSLSDGGTFTTGAFGSADFQMVIDAADQFMQGSIVIIQVATAPETDFVVACGNIDVISEHEPNAPEPRFPPIIIHIDVHVHIVLLTIHSHGETLAIIAHEYGLPIEHLLAANPQYAGEHDPINLGDKCHIPPAAYPDRKYTATCDGDLLTKVETGDNLWDLAALYDVSFEGLKAANSQLGPNFDLIFPGDEVCKPEGIHPYDAGEAAAAAADSGLVIDKDYDDDGNAKTTEYAQLTSSASVCVASAMLVLGALASF